MEGHNKVRAEIINLEKNKIIDYLLYFLISKKQGFFLLRSLFPENAKQTCNMQIKSMILCQLFH